MNADPRVRELEALAREEGITLPMPADLIVYFERMGYVVDLTTGAVTTVYDVLPTPSARAVAHLLAHESGAVAL